MPEKISSINEPEATLSEFNDHPVFMHMRGVSKAVTQHPERAEEIARIAFSPMTSHPDTGEPISTPKNGFLGHDEY